MSESLSKYCVSVFNENRFPVGGISEMLGYSDRWLYNRLNRNSNWLSRLRGAGFSGEAINVSVARNGLRGASLAKTISETDVKILLSYEASLGNPHAAQALLGSKFETKKRYKKSDEKRIQLKLVEDGTGTVEVVTPFGNIDVLTTDEIIEVKLRSAWKAAVGQILAYSRYYPDHKKRIHCYGKFPIARLLL